MNINIDTKYNVGDKVWVLKPGEHPHVTSFKITSIKITAGVDYDFQWNRDNENETRVVQSYTIIFYGVEGSFNKDAVYATKEELLNSL